MLEDILRGGLLAALEKYFGRVQALWKPVATDEAFEIVEEKKSLETLIKSLKLREQFFIQLYVIQELSVPEISKLMKITPNNVYQIKNRVFGKMKMIAQSL